jgi:hypothetical protein
MTCQELYDNLTPEQRQTDVTVYRYNADEFYPVQGLLFASPYNDVLDLDHPYITIQ